MVADEANTDACAVGIGSCLNVRNVADHVSAADLVSFFEQHPAGGRILECRLQASRSMRNHM